jgi:nicotinate-nucleotide adenylyltransferase
VSSTPAPSAGRVGVYGGTFDPVHAGHLHAARAAQAAFGLGRVVFVPAARSPHKPRGSSASPEQRFEMLEIAICGQPTWSVSRVEIDRPPPSYTVDTLRELPAKLGLPPGTEVFFVMGWDNLESLDRWHQAREMLGIAQPIVVRRGEEDPALLERLERSLGPELYARLERGMLRLPPSPESSTGLRERLARGEDPGSELPPGVLEYIRRRGIYRPGGAA